MEIEKFVKKNGNIYELMLDDGNKIKLYDDVIIKYNLLINKKIDNKLLEEITNYNDSLDAYYLSIKYINKKLRSEKEIKKYLTDKEFSNEIINNTILSLKKDGFLNRTLYIKSYINDTYNFTNYGPDKIRFNLNKLGFNNNEIDPYLNLNFNNKIKDIINKKTKLNHKLSSNALKLSISNYLVGLGYSKEMFIDYLLSIKVNNNSLIKKDYELLLKKYSNKYEKNKLSYFIKDKLYKKGYNIEEINEVINDELL